MVAVKLHPPARRPDTLVRSRLVDALNEHVDRKLQIVVAPPGFGKTTLLLDFIHDAGPPAGWITLDRADADLAAFVEEIVQALRQRTPGFGERTLAALRGSPDVERRRGALARTLAADVEEQIASLTLLVLDDFHEVNDSAPVAGFLDDLLRLLPENLRIVLAGRTLPKLTVSRLIVEGQLFGLGEADLRFTTDELLILLRRHSTDITPIDATALAEGADGWIAGFLLSVPRLWEGLVGGMIAARGGEGPLYDYLAAEAFDHQPHAVQRFLLATAVPATPDPALCEALLGPGDWAGMRDLVEGSGLFLSRLRGGAFRYHQLFRDFLQTRLRRTNRAEYARLHTIVARELEARREWRPALGHFREAGAIDEAAALAARAAPELQRTGRWRTLAAIVAELPPAAAAAHPSLLIAGTRASLITSDLARAEQFAQTLRQSGDDTATAWGYAFLGAVRRQQGRVREALDALHHVLLLAPLDSDASATSHRNIAACLFVQGDMAGAVTHFEEALAHFDHARDDHEAALTELGLGTVLTKLGRLAEAVARYESALERWRRLGDAGMEAEILGLLGAVYADRGDYAGARARLQDGLIRARDGGYPRIEGNIQRALGEVLVITGDFGGARAAFERGLTVMQEAGELWAITLLHDGLALTAAFADDVSRAEKHAHRAIALAQRQESRYLEARCSLTLGAIRARAGGREALATLRAAVETLAAQDARRELIHAWLWLAQAQHGFGDISTSHDSLRSALQLARETGSDAALQLHARWNPELFARAAAEGIETTRLEAVLREVRPACRPAPPAGALDLPGLAVHGFGPGTVRVEGAGDVDWTWDKARELFFFLLHGGPRRQEQVMATIWPDTLPAKARTSLYNAVFRLRRAVHPEIIQRKDGVLRVNEELVTSYDVRRLERSLAAAGNATGDEAAAHLEAAVSLYTAPFLDGLDAEWCEIERRRLEERYRLALERLADAHTAAGRPRESIAAAQRLLALDPLREEVHARLVRAYLRLNDRAAAQRQLEACARLLREELGVAPSPELLALAQRITA